MHIAPFRVNFSDPTLLALDRLDQLVDQPHLDIVTYNDTVDESWVWIIITAPDKVPTSGGKTFFPAAHPMHLHGHDFALLRQSGKNFYDDDEIGHKGEGRNLTADKLNCKNEMLKCDNPPRRDVVLLPATGYVVIAFKADNPGTFTLSSLVLLHGLLAKSCIIGVWIIHCHIAFHASSGLAMQIVENKDRIPDVIKEDKPKIEEACRKWNAWYNNPVNHWDWDHPEHFQDDSGV